MYCFWDKKRLRSFRTYPENAVKSALLLAEAGFIYDGDGYGDEVRCVSCGFRKGNWKYDEDVLMTHKSASPSCPFIEAKAASQTHNAEGIFSRPAVGASFTLGDKSVDVGWSDQRYKSCEVAESSGVSWSTGPEANPVSEIRQDRPASTRYASKIARRKSFAKWTNLYPLNRDKMALAGLYATGIGDCTRCFYCGAGIDNWEADDDPWIEQVRLFPCKYVLDQISKGLYDAVMILKRTNPGKISRSMVKNQKRVARLQNEVEHAIEVTRLREEHQTLTRRLQCRTCQATLVGADAVVFQPCGHFIVCINCDDGGVCAECGRHIESVIPACLVDSSAVRDSTRRDSTRRDSTRRDSTRRDSTRRNSTRRDSTRRDSTRRDSTRRDSTRRDSTRRDSTRRDSTRRDSTRRDSTRQDSSRR